MSDSVKPFKSWASPYFSFFNSIKIMPLCVEGGRSNCQPKASSVAQVLFDLRAGNSDLAKVLVKRVTMQCTKMKPQTDACYIRLPMARAWPEQAGVFSILSYFFSIVKFFDRFLASSWPEQILDMLF